CRAGPWPARRWAAAWRPGRSRYRIWAWPWMLPAWNGWHWSEVGRDSSPGPPPVRHGIDRPCRPRSRVVGLVPIGTSVVGKREGAASLPPLRVCVAGRLAAADHAVVVAAMVERL